MLARSDFGLKYDHVSDGRPDSAQQAQQPPEKVLGSPLDTEGPLPDRHASAGNGQGKMSTPSLYLHRMQVALPRFARSEIGREALQATGIPDFVLMRQLRWCCCPTDE